MQESQNQMWQERLNKVIAWGSGTCSKSPRYLPEEPGVIVRGKGCRVWDADGREYIDFRNGLGPVSLGYAYPAVNEAIKAQLENGIVFGQPNPLEAEVAEMLIEAIPCFEQVRFLKTGGEAVAGAIRVARAYTGRDRILQIGYNGWLNSLAGSGLISPTVRVTQTPSGVPEALGALHHSCAWNDADGLKAILAGHPGEFAAIVVSADYGRMDQGATFYPALRKIADENGCLLIYDEIVTGFRIRRAGVQEYFGVVPDLAVFAKGISNGMPLSVFGGRREIMKRLDRGGDVVVSSTYSGETLTLAAAKTVLSIYDSEPVIDHLWRQGEKIWGGLNDLFRANDLNLRMSGFWPCPLLSETGEPKGLTGRFLRAAYAAGVALYNVSYVNYSVRDEDAAETLERLEQACVAVRRTL